MVKMVTEENRIFSIVGKTLPALKATAMRDFFHLLLEDDIYDPKCHNKSDGEYRYGSNLIEFFSVDQWDKVKGRKRDYLWVSEANMLTFADWKQLILRTTEQAFLDFNPDDIHSWINTELEQKRAAAKGDVEVIVSTYKDNKFLTKETIDEIEYLRENDESFWKIYGLGQYGNIAGIIYEWFNADRIPDGCEVIYGLDFGFNNPAALVRLHIKEKNVWIEELFYQTKLSNHEIAEIMKAHLVGRDPIYADSAEPKSIREIHKAGHNIKECRKGPDSVLNGIRFTKTFKVHLVKSPNVQLEVNGYKWMEDRNGVTLDKPVKFKDHAMDAIRYALDTHYNKGRGKVIFSG